MNKTWTSILVALGFIALCQLAGIIGSFATMSSIPGWYSYLNKPAITPPGWLFGPVWITLYTLMGIAVYIIWTKLSLGTAARLAVAVFFIQLILNVLWSQLFFGMRSIIAGLIDIILLWAAIIVTTVIFFRLSRLAGLLMLPYLLWVSFAAVLNLLIYKMN